MTTISREDVEILRDLSDSRNVVYGYGEPTETTKRLVSEDLVEIVAAGSLWHGRLTQRGWKVMRSS